MDSKYSFFNIVGRSFVFFFKNFRALFNLMLPPVILQILGIVLSLLPTLYLVFVQKLKGEELSVYLLPIFVCLVFGLILYCSGFWKYLLLNCYFTYGANDFDDGKSFYAQIYKNNMKNRQGEYVKALLWPALYMFLIFAVGILIIVYCFMIKTFISNFIAVISMIILTIILTVFSLKISLLVPIFTLEPDVKPLDVMKKSLSMTKMPVFFLVLGLSVIIWLISIVFQLFIATLMKNFVGIFVQSSLMSGVADFISSFLLIFFLPLTTSFMTLLYKRVSLNK